MSRSLMVPVKELQIVLFVLQGEITLAEAAWREWVSERAIGDWERQFLEGGTVDVCLLDDAGNQRAARPPGV